MGLLFFLLFFIFAALGVELFGRLECSEEYPCQGLGEHAHFANFGMAFLTLFRVATGDNWNGIMKDTLRDDCDDEADCVRNCCVNTFIAPIFFVIFVLMAQFVLVNVVVAVLMKHLEESHKQMEDDIDMDTELEREFQQEQEFEEEQALCLQLQEEENLFQKRPLAKILSLPSNFTYNTPVFENKFNTQRRQTLHYLNQTLRTSSSDRPNMFDEKNSICEAIETEDAPLDESKSKISIGSSDSRKATNLRKGWHKRFKKELSLDEDSGRREQNRLEIKRMSCDNLPWKLERNFGSIKHKFRDTTKELATAEPMTSLDELSVSQEVDSINKEDNLRESTKNTLIRTESGNSSNGAKSFLSVPLLQQRNRNSGGSCKQLFKQQAMEEETEIDENSLLLPSVSAQQSLGDEYSCWDDKQEICNISSDSKTDLNLLKSDSSEILRIISERRMLERRDTQCEDDDVSPTLSANTSLQSFNFNVLKKKSPPHSFKEN